MSVPLSNSARKHLTVVLSTLGNYAMLKRVIDGYSRQKGAAGEFDMVVVMDAADPEPDAVDSAIGTRSFPIRRITGTLPGLSANRNAGIRAAEGTLVLFTDNDTIPTPHVVEEHLKWHARYEDEATGVLGRVRWGRELKATTFMRWLDMGIQFDFANIKGIDAGWGRFVGANTSLKKSFVERVGEFDNVHLPFLYDDTEWAYRASKLGFRLMYNRRAVVDHIKPTTMEYTQKRMRRVGAAERVFTRLHPEMSPWFYPMFKGVSELPPVRGRGVRLAPFVPRWTPKLGPRVWRSVDTFYKQALAPHFLAGWDEANIEELRARPGLIE